MKVLVLATSYPDNSGSVKMMYVHSRNVSYIEQGIDVTVLNFSTDKGYIYQNIQVISFDEYKSRDKEYDVLISHAPNIREHYLFLIKYGYRFAHYIFFFHGHEVLRVQEVYPQPYTYMYKRVFLRTLLQNIYDSFKLNIWKNYFTKNMDRSNFVFVSNWMKNEFERYVGLSLPTSKTHIIPNSVGNIFETNSYNISAKKDYDFITIRNDLDGSKYCIDVVNCIAKMNPIYRFLIIGKGDYYKHNKKPDNVEWCDRTLQHNEIPIILDKSRCALMPTRTDAQGVMMCELATYGIPVITSNIAICRELNQIFENLILIDNDKPCNLSLLHDVINKKTEVSKNDYFFARNTIGKEIELMKSLTNTI